MNASVQRLWQRARLARIRQAGWLLLPLACAATVAIRPFGHGSVALFAAALLAVGFWLWRSLRAMDARWLVRQLNRDAALLDSADLLLADDAPLNPLQARLRQQLEAAIAQRREALSTPFPRRALIAAVAVVLLLIAASWWAGPPAAPPVPARATTPVPAIATDAMPQLQAIALRVTPPAYTGQAASTQAALDVRAPHNTVLHWQLRLANVQSAALHFHDGHQIALERGEGDSWQARHTLITSALYRVVTTPALADAPLHRLDATPDLPPQVRVVTPEQPLTPGRIGQRHWELVFEASDDYAVQPAASLLLTRTEGSGENITFQQTRIVLTGSGNARLRRYSHRVDITALGAGPGDDVIARLEVRDNRAPNAQTSHSPSLILRLPSEAEQQASDLEGAIKKVLPAYFRSQRQIILDAEGLIAQRRSLDAERFVVRADAIGVDQRILRLRYGQFLGEESEGEPEPPPGLKPPAGDHAGSEHESQDHHDADGHDHAAAGHAGHDHGQPSEPRPMGTTTVADVLAEYGHTHDHAEAATLLDPQTRATLKAALDAMWLSEGELRQGRPEQALPHAYKALGFIKQVQQAERIYLARLGPELPPIDFNRRMGGKRDGLASRRLRLVGSTAGEDAIAQAWLALDRGGLPDIPALQRWLAAHTATLRDPLALAAALDPLIADPTCLPCRDSLRAALWQAWTQPVARPLARPATDAMGQRYLDALERAPESRTMQAHP
ncbi:hypothetical protein ABB25_06945 [Stenotrophomonas koreensis]|uniref:DUF4175 domain-containing protein n=1 Tax=Stenotrophomonas koreensis TaxID=266128 RepID=A0A0R0BNC9_9GAMM|nr:hypothetical protein [Stenotrophomonas koreensis]KRG58377.1 hypothetical protein ABB25_06945 [Stenotrophomonas koreensis]